MWGTKEAAFSLTRLINFLQSANDTFLADFETVRRDQRDGVVSNTARPE